MIARPPGSDAERERDRIRDELARASVGDPWHGASLSRILHGITAAEAATRPIPNAHTIWELVLHMTAWAREVERRLNGATPDLPAEGDWPEAGSGDVAWSAARDALLAAHASLDAALRQVPAARLDDMVGPGRDAPTGTGITFGAMLHGLSQHDAYHAGQISLLLKLLRPTT